MGKASCAFMTLFSFNQLSFYYSRGTRIGTTLFQFLWKFSIVCVHAHACMHACICVCVDGCVQCGVDVFMSIHVYGYMFTCADKYMEAGNWLHVSSSIALHLIIVIFEALSEPDLRLGDSESLACQQALEILLSLPLQYWGMGPTFTPMLVICTQVSRWCSKHVPS